MKTLVVFALAIASGLTSLRATSVSFPLSFTFSGTPPAGLAPWLTATFDDALDAVGPSGVRLTITTNLTASEYVGSFYFNTTISPTNLSIAIIAPDPTLGGTTLSTGSNALKADGDAGAYYDLRLNFPPPPGEFADKLTIGEVLELDIINSGGALSALDFISFSNTTNSTTSIVPTEYYAAAHIQSIGGVDSGWIGAKTQVTVSESGIPEPSTYAALVGLMTGAFVVSRRLRRKQAA